MSIFTGCGTRVVLTTGFGKDVVFTLDEESCLLPEIMVYLTNAQAQYNSIYGSEIWNASLDGVTLEDNVKETILARIAQIKTMSELATSKGLSLNEEQDAMCATAGIRFMSELSDEEVAALGVSEDLVIDMYRDYALADLVYEYIIADINPEISDDEARTVVVMHIFIATSVTSGAGNVIPYGQEEKAALYEKALSIRDRAIEGEDFESLAYENSDEETVTISFGRGTMDEAIEKEVFGLETNQVSNVIENESGYHIFKCISTLDRDKTEENKLVLIEERRQAAFEKEYDDFAQGLLKNLNSELWDQVTLDPDMIIEADFFGIYMDIFKNQ